MPKVILQGYILVLDDDLDNVEEALPEHIESTQREAGCLVFTVTKDKTDPNRFNVYEEFVDREAFEKHQQRVQESRWGKTTKNVTRQYEIRGLD